MAETTSIQWANGSWSPWEGCTKVSPGCTNCYAEGMNRWLRHGANWGAGAPRLAYSEAHWEKPLKWSAAAIKAGVQRKVFPSMCDPFDNEAPDDLRQRFWRLIESTPGITWQLLTKRIGNVQRMAPAAWLEPGGWPSHVWIGATFVNQDEVDRDMGKLIAIPAPVRFASFEPLLGPIVIPSVFLKPLDWGDGPKRWPDGAGLLNWCIAGGESGRNARASHPDWFRSLRDQCEAAGTAFFWKQWGEWAEVDGDKPTRTFRVETDIGETMASRCDGFINYAGEFVRSMDDATTDDPYRGLIRIGKKAAGRLLDGREHNEFPAQP